MSKESKEMEYLKDIKYLVLNEIDNLKNKELWKSYFDKLEQSLTELQQIKSAELTKALECLEELGKMYLENDSQVEDLIIFDTIKQALIKAQRIIKQEEVNKQKAEAFDYLMSKMKFEFKGRGHIMTDTFYVFVEMSGEQFVVDFDNEEEYNKLKEVVNTYNDTSTNER